MVSLPAFHERPPKEGRSWSYRARTPSRRKIIVARIAVAVVAIALCYGLAILFIPSLSDYSILDTSTAVRRPRNTIPEVGAAPAKVQVPVQPAEVLPTRAPASENADAARQEVFRAPPPATAPKIEVAPKAETPKQGQGKLSNYVREDEQFRKALDDILKEMPGEMHVRELLRPVEGTGKEKLREMGLRAKQFKHFLELWEKLHHVFTEDSVHIRDDIVPYLRSHPDLGSISSQPLAQTIHSYEAYRYFLQSMSKLLFPWTAPYFSDHMSLHSHFYRGGRGIVFTVGDDQAPYLLASIPSFRNLGCNLPIEVHYLGDSDLAEDYRIQLEAMPGVITRDISQMVNDEGWKLAGWAAKPFAMLLSSFREIIFVDADALFFKNPEVLFDDPGYKETGALFFKDRLIMPESKKRWLQQVLSKPISKQVRESRFWTGESGHMQESGVVVVDKWKHFVALLMVTRMNGPDRDGNKDEGSIGVYDMMYGDKETFWIGWELVGDPEYTFHQGNAGIMGKVGPLPKRKDEEHEHEHDHEHEQEGQDEGGSDEDAQPTNYTVCAPQLLHLGLDGKPLWLNGWLLSNKFADKKHKEPAVFDVYMAEPTDAGEVDAWQLFENNVCCLTTEHIFTFDETERESLNMMIELAKEAGAYGKPQ